MKVIGMTDDEYICTIRHAELEKFLNQYYGKEPKLKVGSVIDLGRGYDFKEETINALKETEKFIKANQSIITGVLNGITLLTKSAEEGDDETKSRTRVPVKICPVCKETVYGKPETY